MCLFEDDNNSWCFESTSPMMEMGWNWDQSVDDTYWNVQFKPYIENQLSLTSNFVVERLITSSFIIEIEKFLANTFYSFLFDNTGQVCMGFGLESEDINLEMTFQFQFVDCYKILVEDLANPRIAIAGEDALFVDSCEPSSGAGPISLQAWDIATAFDMDVLGG